MDDYSESQNFHSAVATQEIQSVMGRDYRRVCVILELPRREDTNKNFGARRQVIFRWKIVVMDSEFFIVLWILAMKHRKRISFLKRTIKQSHNIFSGAYNLLTSPFLFLNSVFCVFKMCTFIFILDLFLKKLCNLSNLTVNALSDMWQK